MSKLKTAAIVGILMVGVISFAGAALSQTTAASEAKGVIDFTAILVALINLALPAVAGVATYLINGHVKNREMATQLSNAVQNAIGTVQQYAGESLKANTNLRMTVKDPAIEKGVQYVVDNAAEAITRFNIPRERIAQKLEAKVGLAAIETNRAATASPAPGVSGPLAPVPAIHRD
jgi:hypothetical protein